MISLIILLELIYKTKYSGKTKHNLNPKLELAKIPILNIVPITPQNFLVSFINYLTLKWKLLITIIVL